MVRPHRRRRIFRRRKHAGRPAGDRGYGASLRRCGRSSVRGAPDRGDERGKQAVALLICTTEAYPFLDLRVDDHPEPLAELRRLYVKSLERYQPFVACLPGRARPTGVTDRASIEAEILNFHASRMHREQ